jgi:hypothetical protein
LPVGSQQPNQNQGGFTPQTSGATYGVSYGAPGLSTAGVAPIGQSSFTPDYASLIRNDPVFQQLQQQLGASGIANSAQARAQSQRAIVQFGGAPTLDSSQSALAGPSYGSYNDAQTQGLAHQNTAAGLSTQARLTQAHNDQVRIIKDALAARGLLHSGETGYELNRENQAYSQANYDATQQLVDYLAGVQSALAQAQQAQQAQLAQAAQNAYANQLALAQARAQSTPSTPPPGPSPPPPPPAAPPSLPPPAPPPAAVPPPTPPVEYHFGRFLYAS